MRKSIRIGAGVLAVFVAGAAVGAVLAMSFRHTSAPGPQVRALCGDSPACTTASPLNPSPTAAPAILPPSVTPTPAATPPPPAPPPAQDEASGAGANVVAAASAAQPPVVHGGGGEVGMAPPPVAQHEAFAGAFEQGVCATTLDPSGQSQCGNPIGFCDTWPGGFCDDFRDEQHTDHRMFAMPGEPYSLDILSTTGPQYAAQQLDCCADGPPPAPMGFTANEHMMIIMADGDFGDAVLRLHRPFDFAGRTGHIHFDVDLKTAARRYLRLMLSPELTKRGIDDRKGETIYPNNALVVFFINGAFSATLLKSGSCGGGYCLGNAFDVSSPRYFGHDNVRDHVDVYVSRSHVRIDVNGARYVDRGVPDLGFDRAYVYFEQASYNPCKDGSVPGEVWPDRPLDQCTEAAQEFHWDNIAFDGPVLPYNSLTPAGSEDAVFNAYSVSRGFNDGAPGDCTVKGVPASPLGPARWGTWVTWVARLPAGTPVSTADIACRYSFVGDGSNVPRGLELVSP